MGSDEIRGSLSPVWSEVQTTMGLAGGGGGDIMGRPGRGGPRGLDGPIPQLLAT